ncbi:GAF domain-containing protein [Auraticoccus monumenti]|uniref:GAF domain-containing protein n=1 Tax=Auraticoccus monumenti TaxID=675864 RepID=UPI000B854F4E|nr:GAF domain-containing protein [Auraticoccus monumenti]
MSEVSRSDRSATRLELKAWLAANVERHSVAVSVATILVAWLAGVGGALGSQVDSWGWPLFGLSIGLALVAGALEALNAWAKKRSDEAQRGAAAQLGMAVKDGLRPVAELIAQMPQAGKVEREHLLGMVALQATSGLYLLFAQIPGVRAVVYRLDEAGDRLEQIAYYGRGDTPGTFERHPGGRPDPAFEALADNRTRVVHDVLTEPTEHGTDHGYRTYAAVPVVTRDVPHGMLTVDAPQPHSFTATDVAVAEFTAELLAVAFAEAARDR